MGFGELLAALQTLATQLQQASLVLEQAWEIAKKKAKPNIAMILLLIAAGIIAGALAMYFLIKRTPLNDWLGGALRASKRPGNLC